MDLPEEWFTPEVERLYKLAMERAAAYNDQFKMPLELDIESNLI